jgi:hypothetical protein
MKCDTPKNEVEVNEIVMTTPLKAIRAKCLDCSGNKPKEVRLCPVKGCSLYVYRLGHNPKRKGKGGFSIK